MKKKNYAALAVAMVTGGLGANSARAGLYSPGLAPNGVLNGDFEKDITLIPDYSYNAAIASWYRASGGEGWDSAAISGQSNNAYAYLTPTSTTKGEIFQSIGTYSSNYNVSISVLEALKSGSAGSHLKVSLYAGGTASNTGQLYFGYSGYGEGYYTYALSNATLLSSQSITDTGSSSFNLSSFILNTGTAGAAGQTLWLDISSDSTDTGTTLAVDNIIATGAQLTNLRTWTGTSTNVWDSATSNFKNATSTASPFSNGTDVLFDDTVASSKTSITLTGAVSPSSITFNNSSNSYSITGTGSITGGTSLTKLGTGTVSLGTSNTFTGPVAINAGTLLLTNGSALGTSQNVTVASGATLGFQSSTGISVDVRTTLAGNGAAGKGGALLSLSGTNTLGGVVYLAGDTSINVSSGSLTLASAVYGASGITKTGAGTLIYNTLNHYTGDTTVLGGSIVSNYYNSFIGTNLNISSGANVTANVDHVVKADANVSGTLQLNHSFAITSTNLNINSGGLVTTTAADSIGYGGGTSSVNNVNINGGTFNNAASSNEGYSTNFYLTGGAMTATGGGSYNFDAASGYGITSNAAGTVSIVSGPIAIRSGTLTFTVASGTVPSGIDLNVSSAIRDAGGSSIDKEGPGTLALTGSNTYTGGITVNGGTLMIGDGTAGHDGSVNAGNTISNNAAVVFNSFSSQNFGGSINGSGTLAKTGPGITTLSSSLSYSGATTVSAGTLNITGSTDPSSAVSVASLATLGGTGNVQGPVTVASGGIIGAGLAGTGQLTAGSLKFSGLGAINIGTLSNYSGSTALNVSGTLDPTGGANSITINISDFTGVSVGSIYKLVGYSGTIADSGFGAFKLALPRGDTGTLVNNSGEIDLSVTGIGSDFLIWTGAASLAGGWNTTSQNWKLNSNSAPTAYIDSPGDPVVFDDTAGSANAAVNINQAVHPSSVSFNNNSVSYVLQGSNGIAGTTGVTLNGTGTVVVKNANSYTGPTTINAGTLQLGDGTTGHDGSLADAGGIVNNASLIFANFGNLTYGGTITGSGNIVKNGPGTITLSAATDGDTGTLTINAGTVNLTPPFSVVTSAASSQAFSSITVNSGATLATGTTHVFGYGAPSRPAIVINGGTVTNTAGTDNYLGAITMTGGTINGLGEYRIQGSGASVTTNSAPTTATIASTFFALVSNSVFTTATGTGTGPDLLVSSNIDSTGSLTKAGPGSMTISGSNNYSGGTIVSAGKLNISGPNAFPAFTALTVTGGTLVASDHGAAAKNNLLVNSYSIAGGTGAWTGKVDLNNNDMIVRNGNLSDINDQVKQGYNGGNWAGAGGIVSTSAAANPKHLTALGVVQTGDITTFDGQAVTGSDVLVKYTYYGDANLDGKIDGSDYSRLDASYVAEIGSSPISGWYNGDFNYDGVVNGSDYTLIDNAYNTQGATISSLIAAPTAQIAGTSAVPEPATLGLLGIGAIGMLSRRRRR